MRRESSRVAVLEKGGEANSGNDSGVRCCNMRGRLRGPLAQGTGEVGQDTRGAAGDVEVAEAFEMSKEEDWLNYEDNQCPRCGYQWESKVSRPKECPRCKQRLDFGPRCATGTKPWASLGEIKRAVRGPLPRGLRKRVRDAQRRIDNLTARIIEVEGRIDWVEKKLRKMGDFFE